MHADDSRRLREAEEVARALKVEKEKSDAEISSLTAKVVTMEKSWESKYALMM